MSIQKVVVTNLPLKNPLHNFRGTFNPVGDIRCPWMSRRNDCSRRALPLDELRTLKLACVLDELPHRMTLPNYPPVDLVKTCGFLIFLLSLL